MCGGAPKDNSDKVAAIEAQAAREAREAADRKAAQEKADFEARLAGGYNSGLQQARDYFTSMGLNPDDYIGAITNRANQVRGSVPIGDAAPGNYFNDLGKLVYDAERSAYQGKNTRTLNQLFGDDYADTRIGNNLDDDTIAAILGEKKGTAEQYVKNLLDRGVVTQSGYAAALKNVQDQQAGAQARLTELGNGLLAGGRTDLNKIITGAKGTAANLDLGDIFDPYSYQSKVDTEFQNFINGLGTNLRAATPSDLFSTSGLAGIAGASQGGQNTVYDPNAINGLFEDDDDDTGTNVPTTPF